jgi:peptide/nickel transport system substrate-binding protein
MFRRPSAAVPAKRVCLRRIAFVAVCLLLAAGTGCTSGTGGISKAPAAGPTRGTLRVGFAADDYDPTARRGIGVTPLNTNVVETLVRLTPDLRLEPLLAEKWDFVAPNTWRFHLRPGVKFHDGKPLDAAAVKTGLFDRIAAAGGGQLRAGPDSAKVVDSTTVDFTSTIANLRVPEMLAHPGTGVYSPGSDPAKAVGTGPFRLVEYQRGQRIVVERNPDYWGAKARSERIEFMFYPRSADRIRALETGKVDIAFPIPQGDAAGLAKAGYTMASAKIAGSDLALYASARGLPPHDLLSDVSVRKAVALSVDRKRLVSEALGGRGTGDQTHVSPAMLGSHAADVKGFSYDPGKARQLLDAAGWKPGSDGIRRKEGHALALTLVSGYPSADVNQPVPSFLRDQLKAVGISVRIVETASLEDYSSALSQSNGDLFLEQGTQTDGDPAFLPLLLYDWDAAGSYAALFGPGDAYDHALAPALTSSDPGQVQAATAAALHEAIDVQTTLIPLAGIPRVYAATPGVTGLVPHPSFFCVRWDQAFYSGR